MNRLIFFIASWGSIYGQEEPTTTTSTTTTTTLTTTTIIPTTTERTITEPATTEPTTTLTTTTSGTTTTTLFTTTDPVTTTTTIGTTLDLTTTTLEPETNKDVTTTMRTTTVTTTTTNAIADCEVPLFTVHCMTNFVFKIDVNTECLNTKYGLAINHLVIAPGDPKACYPCTGTECDQDSFWFSDDLLTQPITEDSSSIFFKASSCNTRIESDGEFAEFTACFGSDTNSDELNGAIITWEMLPKSEMTCKYDAELAEIDLSDQIGQPIMTSEEEDDETNENALVENETGGADDAPVEVPTDQVETALDTNRDENNNVMIGTRTKIQFDKIGFIDSNFYIYSCTAQNNDKTMSLDLVQYGCLTSDALTVEGIKPRLNQSKRKLSFGQFGFAVNESDNLEFNLKCILYLGPAPECPTNENARQARPEITEEGFDVDFGYGVNGAYTETTNIGGIVVAVSDEDSEEKEITSLNPLGDSGSLKTFSQIVTFLALSLAML